jgi:hypothetical protein
MARLILLLSLLFSFNVHAALATLVSAATATGNGTMTHAQNTAFVNMTMQAVGTVSASTGASTIKLQGSNDGATWIDIGTATLTLGTTATAAVVTNTANYLWYRANVATLTGTNATVSAYLNY